MPFARPLKVYRPPPAVVVLPVAAPLSVIRTPSATMPLTVPEMLYAPVDVKFCPVIFPPLTVTE